MTRTTARFDRPIFIRLRDLCLALPETCETLSWGHPNFQVGTRTFCTLEVVQSRPSIAFRVPPADVSRLERKKHFFTTPYGRGLWISRWLDDAIDWSELAALIATSHRHVMSTNAPNRGRARRGE
jgi:predicted DNA-binding protein (MmcQ/YjbR family)